MAHERWQRADGTRWNTADRIRIERRFRHHVRTKGNPRGRIRREPCAFQGREAKAGKCWSHVLGPDGPFAEAHHVDYARPFAVAWLCTSHHRKVERGTLELRARDVWDYASLVAGVARPELQVDALRARRAARATAQELVDDGPPF